MKTPKTTAIRRLVDHYKSPVGLSNALGGTPVYQEIQRWLRRGWASPMYLFKLKPLLPPGMEVEDLAADRDRVKAAERKAARAAEQKRSRAARAAA